MSQQSKEGKRGETFNRKRWTRMCEIFNLFVSDLSLSHVLSCNRHQCCVQRGMGRRECSPTGPGPGVPCSSSPHQRPVHRAYRLEDDEWGCREQEDRGIFIKRHQTVHGKLCSRSISSLEKRKKNHTLVQSIRSFLE